MADLDHREFGTSSLPIDKTPCFVCRIANITAAIESAEGTRELVRVWRNTRRTSPSSQEDRIIIQPERVGAMQDRHVAVLVGEQVGSYVE